MAEDIEIITIDRYNNCSTIGVAQPEKLDETLAKDEFHALERITILLI